MDVLYMVVRSADSVRKGKERQKKKKKERKKRES